MAYNGAKIRDYSRINSKTGCGFILYSLSKCPTIGKTRKEVYDNSPYEEKYGPGYHSSLWAKMLSDGLIESDGGFSTRKNPPSYFSHSNDVVEYATSAWKKCPPTYFITDSGREVLDKMLVREGVKLSSVKHETKPIDEKNKTVCEDCSHCTFSVCCNPGKTLPTIEEFDEKIGPVGLLTVTEQLDNVIRELQKLRDSL